MASDSAAFLKSLSTHMEAFKAAVIREYEKDTVSVKEENKRLRERLGAIEIQNFKGDKGSPTAVDLDALAGLFSTRNKEIDLMKAALDEERRMRSEENAAIKQMLADLQDVKTTPKNTRSEEKAAATTIQTQWRKRTDQDTDNEATLRARIRELESQLSQAKESVKKFEAKLSQDDAESEDWVEDDEHLHWLKTAEPRGLQPFLHQLNHVALIVRDVGQSLYFYSDIVGFQQIRRPNFDRHGAWLTMGNVELHLIKGVPACHRGQHPEDLIVSHLAIEVKDCEKVLERLHKLKDEHFAQLTWRQNISVPTPKASRAEKFESDHKTSSGKVTQFFLEDPDGYWLELCNCEILTDFCFGLDDDEEVIQQHYSEGCSAGGLFGVDVKTAVQTFKWMKKAILSTNHWQELVSAEKDLKPIPLDEVNQEHFENLSRRRNTYGDICQGFSDDDLLEALARAGNDVPKALLFLKQARENFGQKFPPPSYLKDSADVKKTSPFRMAVHPEVVRWGRLQHRRDSQGRRKSVEEFARALKAETGRHNGQED